MTFSLVTLKNEQKTFKDKSLILFTLKPSRRKFTNKSEKFPYYMCPDPYKYILELFFREPVECDMYLSCAKQSMNSIVFNRFDGMVAKRLNPKDPMIHSYHIQFKKTYKRCCRRLFKIFIVDKSDPSKIYLRSHPFEIYARRRPEEEEFWNKHMSNDSKKKEPQANKNVNLGNNFLLGMNPMLNPGLFNTNFYKLNLNLGQYGSSYRLYQNETSNVIPKSNNLPQWVNPCNSPQDEGVSSKKCMLKKITEIFKDDLVLSSANDYSPNPQLRPIVSDLSFTTKESNIFQNCQM